MANVMIERLFRALAISFCFIVGLFFLTYAAANESEAIDELLNLVSQDLRGAPEKAKANLAKLTELQPSFSKKQEQKFYLLKASYFGFSGQHEKRKVLVQSYVNQVSDPDVLARFLYQLSVSYTNLGQYESALIAINDTVVLLPKLVSLNAKIDTLQAAITLLNSLRAFDEAMKYAERLEALEAQDGNLFAKCYGLANRVEISFLRGESKPGQSWAPEAIRVCDASNRKSISLIVKAIAAIDLIDSGKVKEGKVAGLPLLHEFSTMNQTSDYVTQLEEAIARSFLQSRDLVNAEHYGSSAFFRAKSQNAVQLMEKTSETMAKIRLAQGQLKSAIEYYDINLALKKKVLDDQLQKNLAYQRVKFDMQDKANQLTLLEQKNKLLTTEKQLQFGKNQNLLLLIALGTILLTILGAWLIRTLQLKNFFRTSSQIDGLTQVSNRAHFVAMTTQAFKNPDNVVSLMLLDMDHFKNINDTFGHATGDWVLKTVTSTVMALLSKADVFGRLGGEEFAICLPGASQEQVLALAERCRRAIAEIDTQASGFAFPISASFGIATRGKHQLFNFEETLAAADKALYVSKSEGRNRISVYE
jgi:diguanylate cyclase (GGDEF)-like protein